MKTTIAVLLLSVISTTSHANFLSSLAKTLGTYKQSFTQEHGVGLPEVPQEDPRAVQYRQDFLYQENITEVEKRGAIYYENNERELSLIKMGNKEEPAFLNILRGRDMVAWRNGVMFIKSLKKYTKEHGCIPKITSVSHGWRSVSKHDKSLSKSEREFIGEGHGLSGWVGLNGIYATEETRPKGSAKVGSRSLEKHMRKAIEDGEIKFCGKCMVQFYACNVSTLFVDTFAEISGCQVVAATGKASPHWSANKSVENEDDAYNKNNAFQYWENGGGVYEERKGTGEYYKSGWYRATPVKGYYGEVESLIKENLGMTYIAI